MEPRGQRSPAVISLPIEIMEGEIPAEEKALEIRRV